MSRFSVRLTAPPGAGQERDSGPASAIESGPATEFWDELLAQPAGSTASLWLLVDGVWRAHDNPSVGTRAAIQRAFAGAGQTVTVWYEGTQVRGLVVSS